MQHVKRAGIEVLMWVLVLSAGMVNAKAGFRAGIAVRIVTPDPLLPVSGGVGPSHSVRKKEGELTVRALVFKDDKTSVAIVSSDFLGFPSILGNRVRNRIKDIPGTNILIGATHTHSAPDCYGFPDGKGGTSADLAYLERVCNQMVGAIGEASRMARPARLKVATGEAKGKIAYNYYADQLYDPRCHLLQAVGEDGKPFATLVNYAIHPEVLGPDAGILSPDLVGPLYDRIEAQGGGVGIFMNGAQGGMVTADNRVAGGGEHRTWAECIRIGQLLADESMRILEGAALQSDPPLFCASRTIYFPVDSPLLRNIMKASPLGFQGTEDGRVGTQLNLLNIGNAQIVTIPGEALPNIGYYLKRNMRGEHRLLFGLTNDAFGYILTKEDFGSFKRYDYVTRTSLGERTAEILEEAVLRLVKESPSP